MIETGDIIKKLEAIAGKTHVANDAEKIALYSRDQSFVPAGKPLCVVSPENTAGVQEIVKLAGEYRVPVVPRSSAVGFHGAGIPVDGAIIIDLKRMNRIIEINDRNWYAIIEPGVTFKNLQEQLEKHGFRVAGHLLDPPSASVVSSYMERNPVVTAADFTYGAEHVISYTIVTPGGETFTVGHPPLENAPAGAPDGPGLNFYRIFQGAQGTLGIVTSMIIRVLPMPGAQKVLFFQCSNIEQAVDIIKRTQKKELGLECFALNNFNMAAMLQKATPDQERLLKDGKYIGIKGADPWTKKELDDFSLLRKKLPPWTVVITLSAVGPIPQEKIDYQELDLKDAVAGTGVLPLSKISDINDIDKLIQQELLLPSGMQRRFGYRGSCHQIMFCSAPDRTAEFNRTAEDIAKQFSYPVDDIGIYLQPMERARAFYCSYDLHCSPGDKDESGRVGNLFDKLSEVLIDSGAFFDRPYGKWAGHVYSLAGNYTEYLKRIKKDLDPDNIMNPGKLCFQKM